MGGVTIPANRITIVSATPKINAIKFIAIAKTLTGLWSASVTEVLSFMPANGVANRAPHGHRVSIGNVSRTG